MLTARRHIIVVFLAFIGGVSAQVQVVNLATFLPKSGNWPVGNTIAPAAQLAADDVNNNREFLPDHVIKIIYHETGCNQVNNYSIL